MQLFAPFVLLSLAGSSIACNVVNGVKFTAYGYPDASGTPAFSCNGNTVVPSPAGGKTPLGDGSYNKPYAAASATGSIFKEYSRRYSQKCTVLTLNPGVNCSIILC